MFGPALATLSSDWVLSEITCLLQSYTQPIQSQDLSLCEAYSNLSSLREKISARCAGRIMDTMRLSVRLIGTCLALALLGVACSPPDALREAVGREDGDNPAQPEVSSDEYPPPGIPATPGDGRLGAIVLTNESTWGMFVARGQESGGALVLEVFPNSTAQDVGLVPGDVITWMDGTDINNHEQLLVVFRESQTGQHLLRVLRADGRTDEIEADLVPQESISLLAYLEDKLAAGPDPITRYMLAENLPDTNRAIDVARQLLTEHPQFAEGHALLARLLVDRVIAVTGGGATAGNSPDLLEATTALETASELDPGSASIRRTSSQIAFSLGDRVKAEAEAARALNLDELSAESHFLLGTAQLGPGREAEALESLHRAVELDPFVLDYYVNLAICYRALNREADAQATIAAAQSLTTDPGIAQQLEELLDAGVS